MKPYSAEPDGARLAVRLTPRAGRDAVGGIVTLADGRTALQLRLSAPPVEGEANAALVATIARAIGIPRNSVTIRSGQTSRLKLLHLTGNPTTLVQRLETWIDSARKANASPSG